MQLSVNGIDTFVATGGREFDVAQPTVVLLHGAGFDHTAWALHSRWLAHHGHSVLAPDLPGHGRSSGPPIPTIAGMADWTAALLDAAGVAKAWLVGHSMGSLIAIETAARHPQRVSALSLIGTAATMTVGPDLLKAAEANDISAIDMVTVPATLILGERDMMTPAKAGKALAAALPNSRTVVLRGAGHMMMAERPDELLAALRS